MHKRMAIHITLSLLGVMVKYFGCNYLCTIDCNIQISIGNKLSMTEMSLSLDSWHDMLESTDFTSPGQILSLTQTPR